LREKLIQLLLKNPTKGDLEYFEEKNKYKISCIFVFYKRMDLMSNILHCLNSQDFEKNNFEVILVEDKGGSKEGRSFIEKFPKLNISHFAPENGWGKMGYMRNYGLSKAKGDHILFLDDDTVITNDNFFKKIQDLFSSNENLQAVMPRGYASFSQIKGKYSYHDPFFFTNRCMAYRKECLVALGGFDSGFVGQEDVELAIRFVAKNYNVIKSNEISYYHPPMIYNDTGKGYAVGVSFAKTKYSLPLKCLLLINGSRWLPLYFIPGLKNRYMARFAIGFAKGFLRELIGINKIASYS